MSTGSHAARRGFVALMALVLSVALVPVASTGVAFAALPEDCASGLAGEPLAIGTSSIAGIVTDGATGIAGITVYIASDSGGLESTTTAADGTWIYGGFGDGDYTVRFFDPTFTWGAGFWTSSGLAVDPAHAEVIALSGGASRPGVDAVLSAGQVETISGRITDDSGAPVEGALVEASGTHLPVSDCAQTDPNGEYTLDVHVASYRVRAEHPDGMRAGYYEAGQPGQFTSDRESATALVADGALVGIDIQFPFQRPFCDSGDSAGPLPQGSHSLSGLVTDENGNPLNDVLVYVESPTDGGRGSVRTDAGGEWTFGGLGDSDYVVSYFDAAEAWQSGYWTSTGLVVPQSAAEVIDIVGSSVGNLDIELPAEQLVTISGTVTDATGDGVGGIQLDARSRDLPLSGCTTTRTDGTYEMEVRIGSYAISTADGSMTYPDGHYTVAPPYNFTLHFAQATLVLADQPVTGIDIQFPPTYAISGAVTDDAGTPLDGMSVHACLDAPFNTCVSSAATDANGEYAVGRLPDGTYLLRVTGDSTHRAGYRDGTTVTGDPIAADRITISGGSVPGIDISTFRNATLAGRVTDAGGDGVSGIAVYVCMADTGECGEGLTDSNGDFETGGLQPGSYTVQLVDPSGDHPTGYIGPVDPAEPAQLVRDQPDARLFTVGDADVTGIDFVLPDGARISGTLTRDGFPVDGGFLNVCVDPDRCGSNASTDSNGAFTTSALFPDTYYVSIFDDDGGLVWYVAGSRASADFGDATAIVLGTTDVTGIEFDATLAPPAPPAVATPPGTDVPVALIDPATESEVISLVFDQVTGAGETTLTISDTAPPMPAGFQLGDPPVFYDIETTATFSGQVEVCITYVEGAFDDETVLALLHFDDATQTWEDLTTSLDMNENVICGLSDSFSPFAVVQRLPVFGGFESPVDDAPVVNKAKAGSRIPVSFSLGGDFGLDILADGFPSSGTNDCSPAAAVDAIEATASPGSSLLSYDASTDLYTYVWKTDKSWARTCRTLLLTFVDGTDEQALFEFVK